MVQRQDVIIQVKSFNAGEKRGKEEKTEKEGKTEIAFFVDLQIFVRVFSFIYFEICSKNMKENISTHFFQLFYRHL